MVATAVAVGATSAGAASLITGAQVKNNSLTGRDIRDVRSGDIATILSVGVTKGRTSPGRAAIDALRINNQVFDFEETGVRTGTP